VPMRRRILIGAIVSILVSPHAASADSSEHAINKDSGLSVLRKSLTVMALQDVARREVVLGRAASQQGRRQRDSWIGRHPVLVGTLIGLGAGIGVSAAALPESGNPDVTKGQYVTAFGLLGAGAGAGAGAAISLLVR
jgi:hypothetical protein